MAAQSIYQQQVVSVRQSRLDQVMRRAGEITLEYWPHALTVFLGIIVFAALCVPLLTYLGLYTIAKPIFFTLHLICAQIPSHSFYILGHQLGMCARNMGIYGSMFVGGLIFTLSKKRVPGIPWWVWLLMILPMAYDGLTQMFGLRESTWELRVLTGALFGFGNMWFVLPFIQRTVMEMMDTSAQAYRASSALVASVQNPIASIPQIAPVQIPASMTQQIAPAFTILSQDLETPLPISASNEQARQPEIARVDEDTPLPEEFAPVVTEE